MTRLLKRIVAAGDDRKTRFHDGNNVPIPAGRALRNAPKALVTGVSRLLFNVRPVRPWISYDAQNVLASFLKPSMRVLEFGSGMSTAWYAARSAQVVAIEDHEPWYDKVSDIFRKRGITNVVYKFAPDAPAYIAMAEEEKADGFDLIVIDGSHRHRCADLAVSLIRPGGIIYLDNADKGREGPPTGDCVAARDKLLEWAASVSGESEFFTDFAPTQLFVQTGLLVRAPNPL